MSSAFASGATTTDPLELANSDAWEQWLERHHADSAGVWLRIGRKGSDADLIAVSDALDAALCFGWIDGTRRSLDETSFLQRYSPRRRRSAWSQVNVRKVEALIEAGRMRPAGFAAIEAAKADGRWAAAYIPQSEWTVPDDLVEALAAAPQAREAFESLGRTEQYRLALPLMSAVNAEARTQRRERLVAELGARDGRSAGR